MKKIDGSNGGLTKINNEKYFIAIFLISLVSIVSCFNQKTKQETNSVSSSIYKFYSFATKENKIEKYNIKFSEDDEQTIAEYFNKDDNYKFLFKLTQDKELLSMTFNCNESNYLEFVGERTIHIKKDIPVRCYSLIYDGTDSSNLLIFWNNSYGILIFKFVDACRELTSFNDDNKIIKQLINQIKADSLFYETGGKQQNLPPNIDN